MIKRNSYIKIINEFIDTNFIKILTGIRSSGKTTLLYNIMDELKDKGINKENIIYIPFESFEYQNISNSKMLNELILNLTNDINGKIYLFLDEIQQVTNWEICVNNVHSELDCDIYIASSTANYPTLLSEKYVEIKVYPFSFKEILQYKSKIEKVTVNDEIEKQIFDEYIKFGGMPRLLMLENELSKKSALNDIYASIIYKDIILPYNINKVNLFERFTNHLVNIAGEKFIQKHITNDLKTSRNTILNFTSYLENAFFISKVRREDIIGKKILKTKQKYYLIDHGFHHAIISDNITKITHVLENIVYIELLRRGYEVKIGKIYDREIDFVCQKSGNKFYIQVSYLLASPETIEREFSPLLKVNDQWDKYVLSMDKYDMSQKGIKHRNIIEFLKSDEI